MSLPGLRNTMLWAWPDYRSAIVIQYKIDFLLLYHASPPPRELFATRGLILFIDEYSDNCIKIPNYLIRIPG